MTEKNFVAMEQRRCMVCCKDYDTGSILLNKRFRPVFVDAHTVVGWGLCPEHQKLADEDYIALVGCDEAKSNAAGKSVLDPDNAYRTGNVAHLKRAVWGNAFKGKAPDVPVVFCSDEVITMLQGMLPKEGA